MDSSIWLYGLHAALAAAANPQRTCSRLTAVATTADRLAEASAASGAPRPNVEILDRRALEAVLQPGAVHQGVAVLAEPLAETQLEMILAELAEASEAVVMVLDQAEDPRNIGSVLRSASAFGAKALILQERHSPDATAAMAKAAAGALETVPLVRVTNLTRALDALKDANFWCLGLDSAADQTLSEAAPAGRIAFVLGAEGRGLRRLPRETCDLLVRIPISKDMESLNVAVAAAVALYELARDRG